MDDEHKKAVADIRKCVAGIGRLELAYYLLEQQIFNGEEKLVKLFDKISEEIYELGEEDSTLVFQCFEFALLHSVLSNADATLQEFKQNYQEG